MEKVKCKVLKPFMYNGKLLVEGEIAEFYTDRAARHMRIGDLEKDENVVEAYKNKLRAEAEGKLKEANKSF